MNTRQTFSIDFIIRRCKANKKRAHIFARITVDGEEPKEISIKEQIDADDWNNKSETVKGKSIEVKSINEHINDVRFRIKEKYRELERTEEIITAETVKAAYLGVQRELKGHKLRELQQYFKKIWEPKLDDFKSYNSIIKYTANYLDSIKPGHDVYLSQVNNEFATNLEHYIRSNPLKKHDPCTGNGLGKLIQRFKRILNWAEDDIKWIKVNQCGKYRCPIKKTRRKKLTIQQLVTLEQKDFSDPNIQYVKELFLFSCYTGFAFTDVMQLTTSHFEWEVSGTVWCKLYRQKSEGLSPVPVLKAAAAIINKYRNHPGSMTKGTLFPPITNQFANKSLKIISGACEIPLMVTFHLARHTFATTVALKNGIPIETVQLMLGHGKITTTQIYAEVDEEKILADMAGLDAKLNEKRAIVLSSEKPSIYAIR